MSIYEYSGQSLRAENLATCFRALMGVIEPKDVLFAEEFMSTDFHGAEDIIQKLESITSLKKYFIFRFEVKNKKVIDLTLMRRYELILLIISEAGDVLEKEIHGLVENLLELESPTDIDRRSDASEPNIYKLLWNVYDDVRDLKSDISTIKHKIVREKTRLTSFVSFRFDEHSKALAFELREFLDQIDVTFISGMGYEPKPVSEKVIERLSGPIDLFIIIYSSSGESTWLNQEVGMAKGKNLPIVILVEEGAAWNQGILADNEYIEFKNGTISQTFIRLLEGISFLRKSK